MPNETGEPTVAGLSRLRALDVGDPAPQIVALDQNNEPTFSRADLITGKPLVVLFCHADGGGLDRHALLAFRDLHADFVDSGADILALSPLPVATNRALHADAALPFKILADSTGGVFGAYGVDKIGRGPSTVFVLDPAHRVAHVVEAVVPSALARETLSIVRSTFVHRADALRSHPPVLVLPRVLGVADCALLIERWQQPVRVWPSDGFRSRGHNVEAGDFKVEHDGVYGRTIEYVVRDNALQKDLDARIQRRVFPELRKAFQTGVSRREDYRILRYDSTAGGVLHPHRDNAIPENAHRRFTMTVNLNAGDYAGGALRFREYGEQLYEVERGTAVVWSAALLHEVLPVTRGARYVLGVHMFGT
jgi:peroxiredoxin